MDIAKLKIDKYSNIQAINFPDKYNPNIIMTDEDEIEVVIYCIDKIEDTPAFIKYVQHAPLAKDNRTIFVYKKGRKDGVIATLFLHIFRHCQMVYSKCVHL